MPYTDPTLPHYPDDDRLRGGGVAIDGPAISEADSSEENAFWAKFIKEHPRPPGDIEDKQVEVADRILKLRKLARKGGSLIALTPQVLAKSEERAERQPLQTGYPPEALSEDAWFWTYVLNRRQDYQEFLEAGHPANSAQAEGLLESWPVDKELIVKPLTEDQLKEANAWKIPYLRRLRREQVDESYLNAYLKAWNLSAANVFSPTNKP